MFDCRGIYNQKSECPAWGFDFNCVQGERPEDRNPELIAQEYRKYSGPTSATCPNGTLAALKSALPQFLEGLDLPDYQPNIKKSANTTVHES